MPTRRSLVLATILCILSAALPMVNGDSAPIKEIPRADIAFVVLSIVFELATTFEICRWEPPRYREARRRNGGKRIFEFRYDDYGGDFACYAFFACACFNFGKLFPPRPGYFCESLDCSKVVHNATMTLGCFLFDLYDTRALYAKAKDQPESRFALKCKMLNVTVSLVYVIYDAVNEKAPGPGSLTMVVLACLSEVFLLALESLTLLMTWRRQGEERAVGESV